jgi:hypothetical protein
VVLVGILCSTNPLCRRDDEVVVEPTTFGRACFLDGTSYGCVGALALTSSSFSTLLVFHRDMKDSKLSRLAHALLFMPFATARCSTLGLDVILDGSTYERHPQAPTQGSSLFYDLLFSRALRSERGSHRHLARLRNVFTSKATQKPL